MRSPAIRFYAQRAFGPVLMLALLTALNGGSSKQKQAAVLARVLSYELTLEERVGDTVSIAVVYKHDDPLSEANAEDWMQGLRDLSSVTVKDRPLFALKVPYAISDLSLAIDKGVDVLLVADGLDAQLQPIAQLARSRHVLTAGNALSYVESALTLCIVDENEKTKIYINLTSAELEGIRFSSRLLGLAQIMR